METMWPAKPKFGIDPLQKNVGGPQSRRLSNRIVLKDHNLQNLCFIRSEGQLLVDSRHCMESLYTIPHMVPRLNHIN